MRRFSAFLLAFCLSVLGYGAAAAQESEATNQVSPSEAQDEASGRASAIQIVIEQPSPPERDALAYNAKLFDQVLTQSTEATIRRQKFAAATGITGGMIMVGLGAWRLIEDEPQSAYSRGLGVMFMTLGMADLTTGVFAAARVAHEERRLARWENARKNGVSEVELAHFEGELQAARETRNGERLLVRWNSLTHAIAGVLVLAFTPIPAGSSQADRVSGYVVGALFVGVGLGTFAASFQPTPSEKAWKEYSERKIPMPRHEFSWRLAPSISRRGAGLFFGATF